MSADAVGEQPAALLESAYSCFGGGSENAVLARDRQALGQKPPLEVRYCRAARAFSEREAGIA